jgi:hypothetical protein
MNSKMNKQFIINKEKFKRIDTNLYSNGGDNLNSNHSKNVQKAVLTRTQHATGTVFFK